MWRKRAEGGSVALSVSRCWGTKKPGRLSTGLAAQQVVLLRKGMPRPVAIQVGCTSGGKAIALLLLQGCGDDMLKFVFCHCWNMVCGRGKKKPRVVAGLAYNLMSLSVVTGAWPAIRKAQGAYVAEVYIILFAGHCFNFCCAKIEGSVRDEQIKM